jgi:integrase
MDRSTEETVRGCEGSRRTCPPFQSTFACELLLDGTPIENVAEFLGHSDVRITQKHYAAWVRARQERAEADVRRSWDRDPLVLMETKGTPEVHGQPN